MSTGIINNQYLVGQVQDGNGSPIEGVTVSSEEGQYYGLNPVWSNRNKSEFAQAATTDAQGFYKLAVPTTGDYHLSYRKSGFTFANRIASAVAGIDTAVPTVTLVAADPVVTPINAVKRINLPV